MMMAVVVRLLIEHAKNQADRCILIEGRCNTVKAWLKEYIRNTSGNNSLRNMVTMGKESRSDVIWKELQQPREAAQSLMRMYRAQLCQTD